MDDPKNRAPGTGLSQSDLERLIADLERRLGRLEENRTSPQESLTEVEAELAVMREAVDDLSAGTLDLHNQLIKLVSSCERILAGAGDATLASDRRGAIRRSASALARVARRAVLRSIVAARRLAGPNENGPAPPVDLQIETADQPVRNAPRLAVVVRITDDPDEFEVPVELRNQSDPELMVVGWNSESGRAAIHAPDADRVTIAAPDRAAIAEATSAEIVAEIPVPLPRLFPTIGELCRWTVASEALTLHIAAGNGGGSSQRGWTVEAVSRWVAGDQGANAPSVGQIAKVVGGRHWRGAVGPGTPVVGAGVTRGYLIRGHSGVVRHRIAELSGVVSPVVASDDRPRLLIVGTARGGKLALWLLHRFNESHHCTVVLTDAEVGSTLVRGLTELAEKVYPLAGFLEPAIWPSLVADLARARATEAIIRIDGAVDLPADDEGLWVVDVPFEITDVGTGAKRLLALGAEIAEAGRELDLEVVDLICGAVPACEIPAGDELASVRSAYGVPEEARLVLTICDLEPDHRPEDVAAVARRLNRRDDVYFLVIGQGSLAGSLSDLAGYFELDRFSFAPPAHSLPELVAVSDCVLSTAEIDPWPSVLACALALGRSIVATDVDGVRELVADAAADRCILRPVGDLGGLADAVVEALDTHRRPRLTKKAWKLAKDRSEKATDSVVAVLDRGRTGDRETD